VVYFKQQGVGHRQFGQERSTTKGENRSFLTPSVPSPRSVSVRAAPYPVMYSAVVQDHFHNARRVGPLVGATHTGTAGVPGEGPYLIVWLRVEAGVVREAAYRTFGCPAAIASASVLCELVVGEAVDVAARLSEADLVSALGGLPEGKEHCPPLAVGALRRAVAAS
jgi:nitrogen fixation protein NifU and related proteins